MTATRSRKEESQYKKYIQSKPKKAACQFCEINESNDQLVTLTKNFKIIRNIFGYSVWDSQRVADHLMIVPKKHTDSLADISAAASKEFLETISKYEQDGYNIYARAPGSNMKSVLHQHTHLIKLDGKRIKAFVHIKKPYVRIAV